MTHYWSRIFWTLLSYKTLLTLNHLITFINRFSRTVLYKNRYLRFLPSISCLICTWPCFDEKGFLYILSVLQTTNPIRKITHHFTINNNWCLFLAGVNLYIHVTYNNKAKLNINTYRINYYLSFWVALHVLEFLSCFSQSYIAGLSGLRTQFVLLIKKWS